MLELLALLAVVAIVGTILGVVLLTVVLAFKLAVSVVLLPFKLIAFPVVAIIDLLRSSGRRRRAPSFHQILTLPSCQSISRQRRNGHR